VEVVNRDSEDLWLFANMKRTTALPVNVTARVVIVLSNRWAMAEEVGVLVRVIRVLEFQARMSDAEPLG
jgi:hypothetical protein